MKKLAQNSSSFLDSDPVVGSLVEFADDGPLFAELFNPSATLEGDDNIKINIMDSDDEIEQYLNGIQSGSDSENSVNCYNQSLTTLNDGETFRKTPTSNPHSSDKQIVCKLRPPEPKIKKQAKATKQSLIVLERIEMDENHDDQGKKEKCMNKNAVLARENRQRKKKYMENLEHTCKKLKMENTVLRSNIETKDRRLKSMAREIEYLRNVLANETGLSALLKNIQQTAGLNFSTSFGQPSERKSSQTGSMKRAVDSLDRSSYSEPVTKKSKNSKGLPIKIDTSSTQTYEGPPTPCASPEPGTSGGVCLHVSNNNVSLEFCASCASSAAEVWKVAGDHNYNRVDRCDNSNYVVVKQEVADFVVVKQECTSSDEET